jgi:hypothetical protein
MVKRARVDDRASQPGDSRLSPLSSVLLKGAAYGYDIVCTREGIPENVLRHGTEKSVAHDNVLRKLVTVYTNCNNAEMACFDQELFRALVDAEDHCELCETLLVLEERDVQLWDALDESHHPNESVVEMAECILEEARALLLNAA